MITKQNQFAASGALEKHKWGKKMILFSVHSKFVSPTCKMTRSIKVLKRLCLSLNDSSCFIWG